MADVARETFNRGDALPYKSGRRTHAGPNWMPIHQDCTRSAHGDTATELRARQMEKVAQYPEQRNVRRGVDHARFAVYLKRNACHICPRLLCIHSRFFEPRRMGRQAPCPTDAIDDQDVNLAQQNVNGILLVFSGWSGKCIQRSTPTSSISCGTMRD